MRKHISYSVAAIVAFITLLVYLPTLHNPFIELDDAAYISDNPYIRRFNIDLFRWAFFRFYAANWHPLAWISHALDYAFWGMNPLGHHLTSIVLHSVNTALVVLLTGQLLHAAGERVSKEQSGSFLDERTITIAAGMTGLLFGIHPVHVESVAWVAERKDLLCALFFLLSIMQYMKYAGRRPMVVGGRGRIGEQSARSRNDMSVTWGRTFSDKHYLLALGFFVLALMSKPMAVTLPVVFLILDGYPLGRMGSRRTLWSMVVEKIPFLLLGLSSAIITIIAQRAGGAMKIMAVVPLSTRILVAMQSLISYLGKMLLPCNLLPFYPYPNDVSPWSFRYAAAVLVIVGITVACTVIARKRKMLLSAWGYYVVSLVPVLGIVQVGEQSMANRYTYLPSLGPFLVAGVGMAWIFQKLRLFRQGETVFSWPAVVVTVLLGLPLGYATLHQISLWKDGVKLWSAVLEQEPVRIPFVYRLRGQAFERKGQEEKAISDYSMAIILNPRFTEAYNDLGRIYGKTGNYSQSVEMFDRSISLDPGQAIAYNNRGRTYVHLGSYERAREDLDRAIALKNDLDVAYVNRADLYYRMGEAALAYNDLRRACALGNEIGCRALDQR